MDTKILEKLRHLTDQIGKHLTKKNIPYSCFSHNYDEAFLKPPVNDTVHINFYIGDYICTYHCNFIDEIKEKIGGHGWLICPFSRREFELTFFIHLEKIKEL